MHELPLVKALLKTTLAQAKKKHLSHIESVTLTLGEHTGFVDELIAMYWDAATRDTIAAGSTVEISRVRDHVCKLTRITGE